MPLKLAMMLTTGMLMFGKMSVGVQKIESTPIARVRIDITTKVYGGCDGSRTIHIAIEVRVCAARQRDYASFGY